MVPAILLGLMAGVVFTFMLLGAETHPVVALVIGVLIGSAVGVWIYGQEQERLSRACVAWEEVTTAKRICRATDGGEAHCEDLVQKTCIEWRKP